MYCTMTRGERPVIEPLSYVSLLLLAQHTLAPNQLILHALLTPHRQPKRLDRRIRRPKHRHPPLILLVCDVLGTRDSLGEQRRGVHERAERERGREDGEHVDNVAEHVRLAERDEETHEEPDHFYEFHWGVPFGSGQCIIEGLDRDLRSAATLG